MGKCFISALLFLKWKTLGQKHFHWKPRISVWEGCQAACCPSNLLVPCHSICVSLGGGGDVCEGMRFTSSYKKAAKEATNVSSCIFLCCLTKLHREVESFTMKLWKQTASASTFSIPAAAVQCLLHSPPKITKVLIKCMQFVPISSFRSELLLTFSALSREGNEAVERRLPYFIVSTSLKSEGKNFLS